MRKKVLFITTRLFWPADSGRKVVLWNYCKGLHDELNYDVHLYSFLEHDQKREMVESKPSFISNVSIAKPVSMIAKIKNLVQSFFDKNYPMQCALYVDRDNANSIKSVAHDLQPDVVIVDMIRLAPYIEVLADYSCAKIIDFDDLLSKRYFRQIGETKGNVLGKYVESSPNNVSALINCSLIKNWILKTESAKCKRGELLYYEEYDASLFISSIETREINSIAKGDKAFCATMGAEVYPMINTNYVKWIYDCAFVGNMNTAANQDSLRLIVNNVLPKMPGKSLCVIGVCPDSVIARYRDNKSVVFTGCVESVYDSLLKCKVLLAPIIYGSGIKTKILEAMGMGIPVVTNSVGLEGIDANVGSEVMCGESPQEIADLALSLLENQELRLSVGEAGRQYIERNHQWDRSIRDLGECISYALRNCK